MPRPRHGRWSVARVAAILTIAGTGGGCGLRGLAHDQLYGSPDAADARVLDDAPAADIVADASVGDDHVDTGAGGDARGADLADAGAVDTDADLDGTPGCTAGTCPADQFCDDLTGACSPRAGTGMLSGAVTDVCRRMVVGAKVGIAGQHQCADQMKGSYFFRGLPFGQLTLTAAAPGYQLFDVVVTITPGGNVVPISLVPLAPEGCAVPLPPAATCICAEPTCTGG